MPITLQEAIRQVRSEVNEAAIPTLPSPPATNPPVPRSFTDTEITTWLNSGMRDLARRGEMLFTSNKTIPVAAFVQSSIAPNPPQYPMPLDVVRIYRIEFVPALQNNQIYRIEPSTRNEMDQIWGTYQVNSSSYPRWYVLDGYPGGTGASALVVQLYPVPSQPGTLNVFYYRQPIRLGDPVPPAGNPGNYLLTLDAVEGWDDVVVEFATYKALQKQRNPEWQARKAEYEEKVTQMIDVTRRFHDQQSYISYGTNMLPAWLVGGGEW